LVVPADYNFYQLHLAIQSAFGWQNSHLFQFGKTGLSDKEAIGIPDPYDEMIVHEAKDILLNTIFKKKGDKYKYVYDFGDHWQHLILLESTLDKEPEWSVCLNGENECPPEDVGGTSGYDAMVKCFAAGPENEKKEYRTWLGLKPKENWNPIYFSAREANKRLALVYPE
jgi:hypothetical protein